MEGLEKFREAFEAYSDNYVIIGGTACDITMTGTTVRPRATHDIDMIVVVEKMTTDFAEHFWQFIREGGYRPEKRKQEEGENREDSTRCEYYAGDTISIYENNRQKSCEDVVKGQVRYELNGKKVSR